MSSKIDERLADLKSKGLIKDYTIDQDNQTEASKQLKKAKRKKKGKGKEFIEKYLFVMVAEDKIDHGDVKTEHVFHEERQWRFDYALLSWKIAIEYEGLHSDKSGHTTIDGYNEDTLKYNAATIDGWKVLRYTANTYRTMPGDIRKIMNHANNK